MSELDDMLKGETVEVADEAEVVDAVETKGEETASPAVQTEQIDDIKEQVSALKAELGRIRQKNRDLEGSLTQKAEEPIDIFADPDNAVNLILGKVSSHMLNVKLNESEAKAKETHEDYDAKVDIFQELIQQDPTLIIKMRNHHDPAEFVYKTASNHQRLKEAGDLDKFEKQVSSKTRAQMQAEFDAKVEAEVQKRLSIPGSLSDVRATGNKTSVTIDRGLGEILGR